MGKIGFFGGSFDPIHFGHIHLAVQMVEKLKLDQVLFCPVRCSPHKRHCPPKATLEERMQMTKLAIQSHPKFVLSEVEKKGQGPSFTYEAIKKLKTTEFANADFINLLAEDAIEKFYLWNKVHSLCEMAPPYFGKRSKESPSFASYPDQKLIKYFKNGLVAMPVLEISSSNIRKRIKNKLYCHHLTSVDVLDFIEQNKLYL